MDHVILTRFNLPSKGPESVIRARTGWLRDRIELFERYCLPSVLAQTRDDTKWLIYFDPESPEWLRSWVDDHAAGHNFVPAFRAEVSDADLTQDISALFDVRGTELITTNLDNDDALATDFVARLQAQPVPATTTVYYFVNGLIKSSAGLYRHRDPYNAFPSVREAWSTDLRTCWADWHNHLPRHMSTVQLAGAPGWLQVVHGGNVTNRTRGSLASPAVYRHLFGTHLDDVPIPDPTDLMLDRLAHRPVRVARDTGIRAAKAVLLRAGGRSALDRVKQIVAMSSRSG